METFFIAAFKLIQQVLPDLIIIFAMGMGFLIRGMVK